MANEAEVEFEAVPYRRLHVNTEDIEPETLTLYDVERPDDVFVVSVHEILMAGHFTGKIAVSATAKSDPAPKVVKAEPRSERRART